MSSIAAHPLVGSEITIDHANVAARYVDIGDRVRGSTPVCLSEELAEKSYRKPIVKRGRIGGYPG